MIARSEYGIAEQFAPGSYARVEQVVGDLKRLRVNRLRVAVPIREADEPRVRAWHDWLFPALAREAELLPCLHGNYDDVLADPAGFLAAVERLSGRFAPYVVFTELSLSPLADDRDPRLASKSTALAVAIADAVAQFRTAGKRPVLGGSPAMHPGWLELLGSCGVLRELDAVGIHGLPAHGELGGLFWQRRVQPIREALARHGSQAEVWLTESGLTGNGVDEHNRLRAFVEALDAPVERMYWSCARAPEGSDIGGRSAGALMERDTHPNLLGRLLIEGGAVQARETARLGRLKQKRGNTGVTVITGGAGFIGTNLAKRLLNDGRRVRIVDNLSRPGTEHNLFWLQRHYGDALEFSLADLRDQAAVTEMIQDAEQVFHFAAQVAVTTSLADPLHDFEINGRGTLNLLDALRRHHAPPPLVFTSTNKVYGAIDDLVLEVQSSRYIPGDPSLAQRGIDESRPLAFCSPYGCSKGAADQYVLDFARSFGLHAVVLRMSCVYGPHQFGNEDQGWVAHFLRRAAAGEPISIFGDGRQVRDVLFVDDLVDAFLRTMKEMPALSGRAFNIGGGPGNAVSLLELVERIADLTGQSPQLQFENWRIGDQRWYVSNTARFCQATGWAPATSLNEGIAHLWQWIAGPKPSEPALCAEGA